MHAFPNVTEDRRLEVVLHIAQSRLLRDLRRLRQGSRLDIAHLVSLSPRHARVSITQILEVHDRPMSVRRCVLVLLFPSACLGLSCTQSGRLLERRGALATGLSSLALGPIAAVAAKNDTITNEFRIADVDGNGKLSKAEFEMWYNGNELLTAPPNFGISLPEIVFDVTGLVSLCSGILAKLFFSIRRLVSWLAYMLSRTRTTYRSNSPMLKRRSRPGIETNRTIARGGKVETI